MKAYDFVDKQIMKGVNKGVRAWNYTTGRTKTDLANLLLYAAPVVEAAGLISTHGAVGAMFYPICVWISYVAQRDNKTLEQIEKKAMSEQMMVNPNGPHHRKLKLRSAYWGSCSLVQGCTSFVSKDHQIELGLGLMSAGHATRSLSHYISRADPLPPGKSIFEKAGEKLNEMISDAVRKPVPVRAFNLEDI